MNSIVQIRQISQYPDKDPVFPDDRVVLQEGGLGGPYRSATVANLVSTALQLIDQQGSTFSLNLQPGQGLSWEGGLDATLIWEGGVLRSGSPISAPTFESDDGFFVGGRMVATIDDVNAVAAASVMSFNGRHGCVQLSEDDVKRAGAAPVKDAHFCGWITAPSLWDTRVNDDTVATVNWVHRAIHDTGVSSFNGRTGCVTLTTADVNAAYATVDGTYPTAPSPVLGNASNRIATTSFVDESLADLHLTISNEQLALLTSTYAPINSPVLTGVPQAPTAAPGTHTGQLATTSFVMAAVTAGTAGVSSFNTRTGAVVLTAADVTGAGGAPLVSPSFSGTPLAPTAAPGTSNTQLATTAFVAAAVTAAAAGVSSFNTRTGAVTLTLTDVQATNVLNNTALTGVPTAATAAPGTSSTQLATTAFVAAYGVSSFNSRTGAVSLSSADVSAAGGALLASPAFTGVPAAPTAAPGTSTTQLATTAFVAAALASSGVTTFNGRSGAVTLTSADITGAGGALLAGPTFTGVPAAPTAAPGTNTTQLATTAFVAAAAGAGPVLLNTLTASNSASLTDTTSFTATYSEYEIHLINLIPATAQKMVELLVHSGGTFKSSGYIGTFGGWSAGTSYVLAASAFVPLSYPATGNASAGNTAAAPGICGVIRVANPSAAGGMAMFYGNISMPIANGTSIAATMNGYWNTAGAVDGFQIIMDSGNITSGTVKVYGIK